MTGRQASSVTSDEFAGVLGSGRGGGSKAQTPDWQTLPPALAARIDNWCGPAQAARVAFLYTQTQTLPLLLTGSSEERVSFTVNDEESAAARASLAPLGRPKQQLYRELNDQFTRELQPYGFAAPAAGLALLSVFVGDSNDLAGFTVPWRRGLAAVAAAQPQLSDRAQPELISGSYLPLSVSWVANGRPLPQALLELGAAGPDIWPLYLVARWLGFNDVPQAAHLTSLFSSYAAGAAALPHTRMLNVWTILAFLEANTSAHQAAASAADIDFLNVLQLKYQHPGTRTRVDRAPSPVFVELITTRQHATNR